MNTKASHRIVALVVLFAPAMSHANAGVPMLALVWPAQWLTLLPIIGVETLMVARGLALPVRPLLWPVAKANLLSTAVGIPVAWAAMFALEFVVAGGVLSVLPQQIAGSKTTQYLLFPFTAAWVGGNSPWEVYAAFLVLAVPFCAMSIFVERRSLRSVVASESQERLKSLVRNANIATYALLCALALAFPLLA